MRVWLSISNRLLLGLVVFILGLTGPEYFPLCLVGVFTFGSGLTLLFKHLVLILTIHNNRSQAQGKWMAAYVNESSEGFVILGWCDDDAAAHTVARRRLIQVRSFTNRKGCDELFIIRPDGTFYPFEESEPAA